MGLHDGTQTPINLISHGGTMIIKHRIPFHTVGFILLCVNAAIITTNLSGCSVIDNTVNEMKGSITGNTYTCDFYTNTCDKFLETSGTNINITENKTYERGYSSDDKPIEIPQVSSVITINVDGKQMESCGSTVIFAEKGLDPDIDFKTPEKIDSSANGLGSTTLVSGIVNKYKNDFGKPSVVIIQSQMGNPIAAYSGDKVYWEVCKNLPKTTKLMIDGKALYIHRANFVIVDTALIH